MKNILLCLVAGGLSFASIGQTAQDKELVRKVVVAFQGDFNKGDFKNAAAYTTPDWEHINPGGGITKRLSEKPYYVADSKAVTLIERVFSG